MKNNNLLQLSEIICTRLSHDLIGNIGAVANAIELLDDDPESFADVKPILELSSKVLSSRLKFFRLAFGLSNAAVKNIDELKTIANNYLATIGNRNFPINLNLFLNTPELYKIALLCIMTLSDVFIKGGTIEATETETGVTFKATSSHSLSISKLQTLQNLLAGNIAEENPAQVAPLAYLQAMLSSSDVKTNITFSELEAILQIG